MRDDEKSKGGGEHVLLTAVSHTSQSVWYAYRERKVEADAASVAILQLLEQEARPTRVMALLTSAAREQAWPAFREQVHAVLNQYPECIGIPDGRDEAELQAILERVARVFSASPWDRASVSLDITHGFRHFPMLAYTLALYLRSMRAVHIRGLFYGMLHDAGSRERPAALLDLQSILALPDWVHAVRVFRETGSAAPIAALLQGQAARIRQNAHGMKAGKAIVYKRASTVAGLAKGLERASAMYEAGMPLELGRDARKLVDSFAGGAPEDVREMVPLADELFGRVTDALAPFALAPGGQTKGAWKGTFAWDRDELLRQARVIDSYLAGRLMPLALGLMREWVVSFVMLAQHGSSADMLGRNARLGAEQYLGALARYVAEHKKTNLAPPDESQARWGRFWNQLAEQRNALHHHGMRVASYEPDGRRDHILGFWRHVKGMEEGPPALGGSGGTLLISSQGRSPGVLYSALQNTRPDACLVLCSGVSRAHVAEAAERAGFARAVEYLEVEDPLRGFAEIDGLVGMAGPALLRADRVVANLTGGTTLMSIAVQKLVEAARKLDRPTRRFALIDRRSREEQQAEPFLDSEIHWLDNEEEAQ